MKIFKAATYGVLAATALVWLPSSTGAEVDLEAEIKKHLNDPVACGCRVQDERDLDSRVNSLYAIHQEFQAQKKPYSGSKQTLTPAIRSTISKAVNQRINAVKDP